MRGISGYAKVSLAALAIFLLGLLGHFLLNQSSGAPYTVRTETSASSAAQPVQEEPQKPDSLLEGERININTAPVADLCRLPGIGEKRAEAVAAYREEHGPFQSPEELMEVSGIGPGILEDLRDYITVN